jgi:hypothetical protein
MRRKTQVKENQPAHAKTTHTSGDTSSFWITGPKNGATRASAAEIRHTILRTDPPGGGGVVEKNCCARGRLRPANRPRPFSAGCAGATTSSSRSQRHLFTAAARVESLRAVDLGATGSYCAHVHPSAQYG